MRTYWMKDCLGIRQVMLRVTMILCTEHKMCRTGME